MEIWNYHPETLELLSKSLADESPLETGVWHIPAYATTIEPPALKEGKTLIFNNNEWKKLNVYSRK